MATMQKNLYYPERQNYQSDQQHQDVVSLYQMVYGMQDAPPRVSSHVQPAKGPAASGPTTTKIGGLFVKPGVPVSGQSPVYSEATGQFEYTTAGATPAPATSTSTGRKGQIATDGTYIYIAVADNHWMRAALSAF